MEEKLNKNYDSRKEFGNPNKISDIINIMDDAFSLFLWPMESNFWNLRICEQIDICNKLPLCLQWLALQYLRSKSSVQWIFTLSGNLIKIDNCLACTHLNISILDYEMFAFFPSSSNQNHHASFSVGSYSI